MVGKHLVSWQASRIWGVVVVLACTSFLNSRRIIRGQAPKYSEYEGSFFNSTSRLEARIVASASDHRVRIIRGQAPKDSENDGSFFNTTSQLEARSVASDPDHKVVELHNFCLETEGQSNTREVLWLWNIQNDKVERFAEKYMTYRKNGTKMFPSSIRQDGQNKVTTIPLKVMDVDLWKSLVEKTDSSNSNNSLSSDILIEWLDDDTEYHLFRRQTVDNLFHWVGSGFFLFLHLFYSGHVSDYQNNKTASTADKNSKSVVFHIPSLRRFNNLVDLSYVQFVQLFIGVNIEQRTVYGPVLNMSNKHVDEMLDDARRFTCFRRGTLGVVTNVDASPGSFPFQGWLRRAFKAYIHQFRASLGIEPPSKCPPQKVKASIITRPKRTPREIVNLEELTEELEQRQIRFDLVDMSGRTFRQQVELITHNIYFLVAAHGQALWSTIFLPETASVIEILPFGFPYNFYVNIAASHGLTKYTKIIVDRPWHPVTHQMTRNIKRMLLRAQNVSIPDSTFDQMLDLAKPHSYATVSKYLMNEFNLSKGDADVQAKKFVRDQPLHVNTKTLADAIEAQYRLLQKQCGE